MALRNVLFIMCDQLRWDHLGCAGHPHLATPNIDALAAGGVRFSHAFANSGVCGPSRMSFYTGRYPVSHGATWNAVPLSIGEATLGDHLAGVGRQVHLAGKSHVIADEEGIRRRALAGAAAAHARAGGFAELDRHDGHGPPGAASPYAAFLRRHGYASDDPWSDFVISTRGEDGSARRGWAMRHVRAPALVREEHSETAYMTGRAIEFIEGRGDRPWFLHLSYVKPHWPYVAPAPYHALYGPDQCLPVIRDPAELRDAHPALAAYRQHDESRAFADDACIATVRPVYQGLIAQVDRHVGRVLESLDRLGSARHTLVVFTSDHGDLLGDHWLGEKELFYDAVQRLPLIIRDPDAAADKTRGTVDGRLVEAVDVLPTALEAIGLDAGAGAIEGVSLLPALRGAGGAGREFVYSELDYAFRRARLTLGRPVHEARAFSIRDRSWRYVSWLGLPEQLYDLESDPHELQDLGRDEGFEPVRAALRGKLCDFLMRRRARHTVNDAFVESRTDSHRALGVRVGEW